MGSCGVRRRRGDTGEGAAPACALPRLCRVVRLVGGGRHDGAAAGLPADEAPLRVALDGSVERRVAAVVTLLHLRLDIRIETHNSRTFLAGGVGEFLRAWLRANPVFKLYGFDEGARLRQRSRCQRQKRDHPWMSCGQTSGFWGPA